MRFSFSSVGVWVCGRAVGDFSGRNCTRGSITFLVGKGKKCLAVLPLWWVTEAGGCVCELLIINGQIGTVAV